jgi:hypothetical protein
VVSGLKPGAGQGVTGDVVVVMCRRMPVCRKGVEEQKSDGGGQHGGREQKRKVGADRRLETSSAITSGSDLNGNIDRLACR